MGEGLVDTSTEGSTLPRAAAAAAGGIASRARTLLASAGVALAVLASSALAQQPPSSGTLLKELGPTVQPSAPQTLPPPLTAPPQAVPIQGGAATLVTDFRIRATQFPEATLKALLKDYIGRELTLAELQEAAGRISEYYRAHDILARAYVPQQKIENGVVEIIVLEGTLGGITVDPASVTRLNSALATGIVGARAPVGQILHPRDIQEGVAILNEIPGVAANATLVPGANPGETNADLKLADRPLVSGLVQTDNEGQRFAGAHRLIESASVNDPFGLGEQATLTALETTGSTYSRFAFTLPVGTSGLTLGINGSGLLFHLGVPFDMLNEGGYAYTGGLTAAYPIRRTPDLALTVLASFDHKRLVDWALDTDTSNHAIEVGNLRLVGLWPDQFLGGGLNNFGIGGTLGTLDRSAVAADLATDSVTARTNGTYGKLSANLSRVQALFDRTELYMAFSGQFAFKNLESSEQFSLGGPDGVRAYPVTEATGDNGAVGTLELRRRIIEGLQLIGFYDVGGIELHESTWKGWQTVPGQPDLYLLQGAGVGASWAPVEGLLAKATYARAIGDNPGHDINGNDSDGKHSKNRFWLQLSYVF